MTGPRAFPGRFICEPLTPVVGTITLGGLARGEPGMPGQFTWRGHTFEVAAVLDAWKSYAAEGHVDGGERYLRKHWYRIAVRSGEHMTIYCDRAPRNPRRPKQRWWLHSLHAPDGERV